MKDSAIKQYSNKQDASKPSSSAVAQLHISPDPSKNKPTKQPKVIKAADNTIESLNTEPTGPMSTETQDGCASDPKDKPKPASDQKAAGDSKAHQHPIIKVPVAQQSSALCCGVNRRQPSIEVIPPAVTASSSDPKTHERAADGSKSERAPVDSSDLNPSSAVESEAKTSEPAVIESFKVEDPTANVKRKVEFEEVPTVKKYREVDEAVSESKSDGHRREAPQTKGLRSELDDAPTAFDVESISDIDSYRMDAPKSSASPMKKASAFKKPKQSLLDESRILGVERSAAMQLDDVDEVPTRWKK